MKKTLSVVLATKNEESNIGRCLDSVKGIANEIIVFDEESSDKTRDIAKSYGARVFSVKHEQIFHITKQKAIDKATCDWILQLDADEVVSKDLANEIMGILEMNDGEIENRRPPSEKDWNLFMRHQRAIEKRDGALGRKDSEIVAFFIPRLNMFVGRPLIHGGVYPDGVIRLLKKDKAYLPGKSVHEQMVIDGQVSWLFSPLEHYDSPTLARYIMRFDRYTTLFAKELHVRKIRKNSMMIIWYSTITPLFAFTERFIFRAGFKDGMLGFMWAALSAWHYPIAFYKYYLGQFDEG